MYLAVNENGEFRLFVKGQPPRRTKKDIMVESKTEFEENLHGRLVPKWVPSGPTKNIWTVYLSNEEGSYEGIKIDKKYLSKELQKLTWEDEPIEIKNNNNIEKNKDNISPIPITLDILKNNGFKKCKDSKVYILKLGTIPWDTITVWQSPHGEFIFNINGDYLVNRKFEGKLEYIHELQQIIKFCRIDKEII